MNSFTGPRLRSAALAAVLAGGCVLAACASVPAPKAIAVSEVVAMAQEGVPQETIMRRLLDSQTVYRLDAAQIARLHEQGVPDAVLDYMQETYLASVRRDQ